MSARAQPRAGQLVSDAPAAGDSSLAAGKIIEHRFVVEPECHGFRLDRFLKKRIPRLSRERVQRVIRGECWVDGRDAKPSLTVRTGQEVVFRRPAPVEPEVPRTLPILYADEDMYALDKPAGIAMHPSAKYHHATVTAVLRELFPEEKLQITHRLDLETSGIILVARHLAAAVALKRAFAKRQVEKRYLALVHGALDGEGVIDQPLGPCGGLVRVKMAVVRADAVGALPAVTTWRALERRGDYTLVECWPKTGRQHQIRAHLDWLGHPLVGDKLYPDEELFVEYQDHGWEAVAERLPLSRQALHASFIAVPHPRTGQRLEVNSPWPKELDDELS